MKQNMSILLISKTQKLWKNQKKKKKKCKSTFKEIESVYPVMLLNGWQLANMKKRIPDMSMP